MTAAIYAVGQPRGRDVGLPGVAVAAGGTVEVGGHIEVAQVEPQQKAAQAGLPELPAVRLGRGGLF